jgi:hypothetical protein
MSQMASAMGAAIDARPSLLTAQAATKPAMTPRPLLADSPPRSSFCSCGPRALPSPRSVCAMPGPSPCWRCASLIAVLVLLPLVPVLKPEFATARAECWIWHCHRLSDSGGLFLACATSPSNPGFRPVAVAIIVCLQPILVALHRPASWSAKASACCGWLGLALGLPGRADSDPVAVGIQAEPLAGRSSGRWRALWGSPPRTLYEKRFGVTHHPVSANLIQYAVGAVFTLPWPGGSRGFRPTGHPSFGA